MLTWNRSATKAFGSRLYKIGGSDSGITGVLLYKCERIKVFLVSTELQTRLLGLLHRITEQKSRIIK